MTPGTKIRVTSGTRTEARPTGSLRAIVAVGVSALLSVSCAEQAGRPGSSVTAGYAFDDVRVLQPGSSSDVAMIQYDIRWTTDSFPGVFECSWLAYGQDGDVVGEVSGTLLAMEPPIKGARRQIAVTGPAVDVSISCGDTRLDQGDPYAYAFKDVHVESSSEGHAEYEVVAEIEWLGSGHPGPVTCELRVYDPTGSSLYERVVNVMIADGRARDFQDPIRVRDFGDEVPATAAYENCRPFQG